MPSERERTVAVRTNVRDLSVNVGAVLDAIKKLRDDRHMDRLEATVVALAMLEQDKRALALLDRAEVE